MTNRNNSQVRKRPTLFKEEVAVSSKFGFNLPAFVVETISPFSELVACATVTR